MPMSDVRHGGDTARPGPAAIRTRSRRLAWSAILAGLVLAGCGGDREEGLAETEGVSRSLCAALGDLATSFMASATAAENQAERVAAGLDAEALLEVLPDDAPGEVRAYFEALSESLRMDEVWKDPETGLIEDEYFDDFLEGLQTMQNHEVAVGEYAEAQCSGGRGGGGGWLGQFAGGGGASPGAFPGSQGPAPTVPPSSAEVLTLLEDGPAGIYEQVTLDIATVTATDAEPGQAFTSDPVTSGRAVLLVDIEAATDVSEANQFGPGDFRLEGPDGTTVAGESIVDRSGASGSLQLRGRDSAQGTVVFATESLVRDVRGYRVLVERDDRVPTVLAFDQSTPMPYPVALEAGATGAFTAALTPACSDDYETSVASASAELDAEGDGQGGIVRSPRRQRWIRIVLDVTNVTVQGPGSSASVCQAFSGNYASAELRLDADGALTAPVNGKDFGKIEPGTTGERVHVFAVDADARSLALVGPAGEALGSWTMNLPAVPGES